MGDINGQQKFYGVFLAICWITVLARVYVRIKLVRSFGYDDYLMIISLVFFTVIVGLAFRLVAFGMGKHVDELPASHVREIVKIFFCEEIVYFVATVTAKLSIAIMLLRLAQNQYHRQIIRWTAIFYTICGVAFVLVACFQCAPIHRYWDPAVKGTCMPRPLFGALMYTNATISLITDAIFAILPTFLIWNTQMNRRTKISVSIVLGLGISTSGVNIARLRFIRGVAITKDPSYDLYPIGFTSILEVALGIVSASLATLRPLLRSISAQLNTWSSCFVPSTGKGVMREAGRGGEEGSEYGLADPQGKDEERMTGASQMDVDEWIGTCLASQERANEDTRNLNEMRKSFNPAEGQKSHYHISQELDLPPLLRCSTDET